ncbi:DUF3347 domain-containing protein [Niabella pedocola]|uniref:DUF3347 domain-containing protein n=1 Tax=Niabella pedocola TaxID=1752077 RepID=A0ABS8PX21_9BACT|nr:DUF3347 domain-containing protein [Niabella pedocola]MCD2425608.1 DUF3347 domain-containing protein [Niabella pedocola]
MQSTKNIFLALLMGLATTFSYAHGQIKHSKTVTVSIRGNASACKTLIEEAGSQKKQAQLTWDAATQKATLVYNSHATTKDAVLKRVALAGFDNESYYAPLEIYRSLPEACKYKGDPETLPQQAHTGPTPMQGRTPTGSIPEVATASALEPLYKVYFAINNALVQSDDKAAAQKATQLNAAVKAVKMDVLSKNEHQVWMTVMGDLQKQAAALQSAGGIEKQRAAFGPLSETIYKLIKASSLPYKVYYNHCPMYKGGANWLSSEQGIKNPYYGSKMLTCGSTKETLQ